MNAIEKVSEMADIIARMRHDLHTIEKEIPEKYREEYEDAVKSLGGAGAAMNFLDIQLRSD